MTCITTIELEHVDKLGDTLAKIAHEKAGIAKSGVPLICGPLPTEASASIRAQAKLVGAPVWQLGAELPWRTEASAAGVVVQLGLKDDSIHFAIAPGHAGLAVNHALAVSCLDALPEFSRAQVAEAATVLHELEFPGRLELLRIQPWVLVDGAHTQASIALLAAAVEHYNVRSIHLVVSVSGARDAAKLLRPLLCLASTVTATQADPDRSLDAHALAEQLAAVAGAKAAQITVESDPVRAIQTKADGLDPDEMLLVAGSMYLAGRARKALSATTP